MRLMTVLAITCVSLIVANAQTSRPEVGHPLTFPPASGFAKSTLTPTPGSQPTSLQDLCVKSALIVDATVQRILPVRVSGHHLETDVVLDVTRVIKGQSVTSVALSQIGGTSGGFTEEPTQYSLMQVGERYLVFGNPETRALPQISGVGRFAVTGIWSGHLRVDNAGRIRVSSGAAQPLRRQIDGLDLTTFLANLTAALAQ